MLIEIHGHMIPLNSELKSHAETRVWLAAQRHADRIAWISVLFEQVVDEAAGDAEPHPITCKIAAGLRSGGTIVVRQTDVDPFAGVDLAGARFERALSRQLSQLAPAGAVDPIPWEVLT